MTNVKANGQTAISVSSEVFSWDDARRVCTFDANGVAEDRTKYVKDNVFQYYLCTNTWLITIECTMGDRAGYSVSNSIRREGLLATIGKASDLANALISYHQGGSPVSVPMGWFMPEIHDMDLRAVLQCLRYPKRFTPAAASILERDTYKKFLAINKYDKETNYIPLPNFIADRVREYLCDMTRGFNEAYADTIPKFSAGSTTAGRTTVKKLAEYAKHRKYWCDPLYPIGDPTEIGNRVGIFTPEYKYTPTVRAVPKNYKGYRIIAPEHPFYAAEKQRIKDAIRAILPRNGYGEMYKPEDQGINRNLAFEGAVNGEYATIDLTSASDTIAATPAFYLLPNCLIDAIRPYWCEYMIVNKEWYRKRMFATSGDPICFDIESMLFLSIALSVRDICTELTGDEYNMPSVYGDDLIVDSRLFESVMDVLTILRFIPNWDKSFGVGGYRESCGVEYYYGYDVSTKYWPRRVVQDPRVDVTVLESLCDLEHRLFDNWKNVKFLTDVITYTYPKMTSSEPGSVNTDLWADSPWCALRCAPIVKTADRTKLDPLWTRREAHTSFSVEDTPIRRDNVDLEMYHYVNFLRNGPIYADALDESLGISQPTTRTNDWVIPRTLVSNVVK